MKITRITFILLSITMTLNQAIAQISPEAWTNAPYIELFKEVSFVNSGTSALRVKINNLNYTTSTFLSNEIPVSAGETFEFSYKYWVPYQLHIIEKLEWTGASDQILGYFRGGGGTMQYLDASYSGIVPDGATGVRLGFIFYECLYDEFCGFDENVHFGYFDDVSFQSPSGSGNRMANASFENWVNRNWAEILNYDPEGTFGISDIAVEGDYAVIGCSMDGTDSDGNNYMSNAGAVYILKRNNGGKDNWGILKKIVPGDRHADDYFGTSVDIYSTYGTGYLVVGSIGNDYDAAENNYMSYAGAAYVFYRDNGGTDNWGQVKKIVPEDRHASDYFGGSVSIVYTYVAVGAYGADYDAAGANPLSMAGAAYLFYRDQGSANAWGQIKKIVPPSRYANDRFGDEITLSGDYYLAAGTSWHGYDATESNYLSGAGAVYLFQKDQDGTGNWGLEKKIVPQYRHAGDAFGSSIGFSSYSGEQLLLAGAIGHDYDLAEDNYLDNSGAAYLFRNDQGSGWDQEKKFISPLRTAYSNFGNSVSVYSNYCAIGESECNRVGAIHFYNKKAGGTNLWGHINTVFAKNPVIDSEFGDDVELYMTPGSYPITIIQSDNNACLLKNILPPGIIEYSDIKPTEFTLKWTDGENIDLAGISYTVFISSDTTGIAIPEDKTTYTSGTVFGTGTQINSSGWYCIYNGSGNTVTVTGLDPDTKYRVTVCLYSQDAGNEKYYLAEGKDNPGNQVTGINLGSVGIHVANNLITGTTTKMEYSLNSTNGTDGTWTICTETNTTVLFSAGPVYIRQKSISSNHHLVSVIPPKASAPAYTINFFTEQTNEVVPDTIEYNTDNDFTTVNLSGTGLPVGVTPGINFYFRAKGTETILPGEVFHLMVPGRPSATAYSVDFVLETTADPVSVEDQYSYDPVMNSTLDGTGIKILLEPGKDIYFRKKATNTTFSGEIQHMAVPTRPGIPVVSLSDKNSPTAVFMKSSDGSGEQVAISDGLEFSENFGISWDPILPITKVDVSGMKHIMVRQMSTIVSFASEYTSNLDYEKPAVSVITDEACNGPTDYLVCRSNLDNGNIYLIAEGESQASIIDFNIAIDAGKGSKAEVNAPNADVHVTTSVLVPGTYYAYATNDWDSLSNAGVTVITIYEIPVIDLGEDIVKCENTEVTIEPGTQYSSYLWNYNDATTQSIIVADEDDYILTVTNEYGCQNTDTISVRYNIPYQDEQICVVTIDLATGKNLIVWEKTPGVGIIAYNIYRESTIGTYNKIGTISAEELSVFKDTTGNPESQAYLYKITAIDSCGKESLLASSKYHRPSFLQYVGSVGGVNLEWTDYNIQGIPDIGDYLSSYVIYRGTDSTGLSEYQVVGSINTYTDTDPNAMIRKYYYRVAALLKDPCYPTGTTGKKAETGPYSHSMSNMEDNRLQTGAPESHYLNGGLVISPNPFNKSTMLMFNNVENYPYTLYIMDLSGKVCRIVDNINTSGYEIKKENLKKGLYFIELRGLKVWREKIVIE